jgi:hypothetical protein
MNKMNPYLLMNLTLYFNLDIFILLILTFEYLLSRILIVINLYCTFLTILCSTLPKYLLYNIVNRHIHRCTSQPQRYNKALCWYFFSLFIQIQIDKALDNFLLEFFTPCPCLIDHFNLFGQVVYLVFW